MRDCELRVGLGPRSQPLDRRVRPDEWRCRRCGLDGPRRPRCAGPPGVRRRGCRSASGAGPRSSVRDVPPLPVRATTDGADRASGRRPPAGRCLDRAPALRRSLTVDLDPTHRAGRKRERAAARSRNASRRGRRHRAPHIACACAYSPPATTVVTLTAPGRRRAEAPTHSRLPFRAPDLTGRRRCTTRTEGCRAAIRSGAVGGPAPRARPGARWWGRYSLLVTTPSAPSWHRCPMGQARPPPKVHAGRSMPRAADVILVRWAKPGTGRRASGTPPEAGRSVESHVRRLPARAWPGRRVGTPPRVPPLWPSCRRSREIRRCPGC